MTEYNNIWLVLCQEETLLYSSMMYGMSWPGLKDYSRAPLRSLFCSAFVYVPLSVIGTACVAAILPKNLHGCIPLALTIGAFHCLTKNE